ncbi:MAG: PAS domain-containing protein [Nitrospirae bacterium]|nr:PAS domain-containing protein [Nitrospirota bacterium]
MTDNVIGKKLRVLATVRVIFVTLLLGSFVLLQIRYSSFLRPRATLNLIIGLYSLTIFYSLLLDRTRHRHNLFAYAQLFIDAIAANILIYLTGGIESWFSFIIPLIVMSASTVLNRTAGYVMSTFNSILYAVIIGLQYYKRIPLEYASLLTARDFFYNIFAHISAFYIVAFLSGYLSSRLEKTAKALEQTDSNLKELALFNKELIENIPSGIFTTDNDGRILIFNKSAENITGIGKETAMEQKISGIFPFLENLTDIKRAEGIIKHQETGERIIGMTVSSLRDISGRNTGFIGIFQDLTHVKMMEVEIKQQEQWATIGELSANIAHEIRNPIASIKGFLEMLKEGRVAFEHKEKLTEIVLKEIDRLDKVITDFLTYSRPKPVEFSKFDLSLMLEDALELLSNTTDARDSITIRKDIDRPLYIDADRQKLQQVFWNLGMNAIEAMPSGGELLVSTKKGNGFIEIIFRDTGVGIQESNLGKIFYPFFTTKEEGTGLGLAIAYRLIEEHRGSIKVMSKPNSDTSFKVLLPQSNGRSE